MKKQDNCGKAGELRRKTFGEHSAEERDFPRKNSQACHFVTQDR
jgi:hypothetical protein